MTDLERFERLETARERLTTLRLMAVKRPRHLIERLLEPLFAPRLAVRAVPPVLTPIKESHVAPNP